MERLADAITEDGYESVAREIGMGVLGLIDEAKREEKEFFDKEYGEPLISKALKPFKLMQAAKRLVEGEQTDES